MKSLFRCRFRSIVLLFVLLIENDKFLTSFAAPTLDNEIPIGKDEDAVRSFRDKYTLHMKSYMNTSADPCDDFYEFACGNFANVIEPIETMRKRNNLLDLAYVMNDLIEITLQKRRHPEEKFAGELAKAKQLLDSCMQATIWPKEPKKEFLEVINAIGGFPAIDPNWNASNFDWFNMTAHLSRYGINALVKEEIYLKHPFPPYFELPKFGFDFDVYLENIQNKDSPGYVYSEAVMRDLLTVYGVSETSADKIIEEIVEFWRQALIAEKRKQRYGNCDYLGFLDDTQQFDKWNSYFEIAWPGADFTDFDISECPCDWYYHQLEKIIAKRPAVAANYMALKFLFAMHPKVKSSNFQRTQCLSYVKKSFPILLTHFYLQEHYNKSCEDEINEIITEIKHSMKDIMNTADWLDEPTRLEALEKIKTLKSRIGQVFDPVSDLYIKEINKINITDNLAANILETTKFLVEMRHYGFFHQELPTNTAPYDLLDATQVNAFYYVLDNSINVMAGILHPPIFHSHLPKSIIYGSLGYILGHELTHGFDNVGSNFDSNLTMRNWWSEKSSNVFEERMNCFAQHYSEYTIPELNRKLNGTTTQDENIADSGGLREALAAYRRVFKTAVAKKLADFEKNESLPGLSLSPEQTFFVGFAQIYCSKYDLRHYWVEYSDDHPLDRYRVLGSLQNFEEFSVVYNCPLGSRMNPNEKCRLW